MSREMKDSGIEWIGKIPEDWEVVKLGVVADISTGNTPTDPDNIKYSKSEGVDWLKTNNLLGVDGVSNSSLKIKEQYISEARLTNPRSVLITCIGDIGKLGYTSKPVAFNQQINSITFTKDIVYWKYGMYALYSQREQQESFANGNVLKILNRENQKKVVITVPKDINKQIKISNALDKICLYIRKLVDKTQLSIKELKKYKQSLITEAVTKGFDSTVEMKDSGIEWIGKIPKHWQTIKMKYLLSTPLLYGANEPGVPYQEDLPRYIRITDILNNNKLSDINKLSLSLEKAKSFFLKENDILFARSGASVGKTFLISKENVNDTFAGYLIKASFKDNVNAKYIFLFTQSYAFENWKNAITIQSTIQNIGANRYNNLIISLPTYEEQQQIVQYLDSKISAIDNIIADKTKVIEELESYKKSLIYEYVTGKKEV
ncbi:restriction endonuclease subunit S [Staphylococcus delphini]|uniref:restriction endonuclease subunit S n=1 Tax=Staphylococcus delphini TaxID=53344 RepID=UPI0021CFFF5E|nr:restriction endonuclease subunit S [Staphylococcus delphini]UXS36932.1 restriction endonuclease subunit S [Staphylococcus delphini]UXS44402.1 restriction endonuclease subunit S [Staphylococcus delphini]UXV45028.1 restriction endonuclease subunit S [Staphylococcus delphini]